MKTKNKRKLPDQILATEDQTNWKEIICCKMCLKTILQITISHGKQGWK